MAERISDDAIWRCFELHDAQRVGRRGEFPEGTAEAVAAELRQPYERVRDVVLARMFGRFGG